MNLDEIRPFLIKPTPFTPGEALFWDDPHISNQMLEVHLDPNHDIASRRPEIIDRTVDWLIETLNLKPGDAVLDLGCGPGLYASRLAKLGLKVTGIDYSHRSIEYAQDYARQHHLEIEYRCQNYLDLTDTNQFDLALLIYGDFCPLSPSQRTQLLQNIQHALKPGGYFVLDVTTHTHRQKHGNRNGWYLAEKGFWKPGAHLVLEEGFDYPEQRIYLDQAIVIEENGQITVYRNWFQDYSRESITQELGDAGFIVQGLWNDLCGTPFTADTDWIGIIAKIDEHQGDNDERN